MASAEGAVLNQPTGSPPYGEPVFLVVGKLRRPHGVRGEIMLDVSSDFPEHIAPGVAVYVGEIHRQLVVASRRNHGAGMLVSFEEFATPEAVGVLRNQYVYVLASDRPALHPGEYYHHQIIGLQVLTEAGIRLGQVTEILETGAHDVCVIAAPGGEEILLPVNTETLLEIDLPGGVMRVRLIPGILPGD